MIYNNVRNKTDVDVIDSKKDTKWYSYWSQIQYLLILILQIKAIIVVIVVLCTPNNVLLGMIILIYINILRLFLFHLLSLLLPLVCLSTFSHIRKSATFHVSSTIVILATKVTFYSAIKKKRKNIICIAVWGFVLRVLTNCMNYNKDCTLYSLLALSVLSSITSCIYF